MKTAIAPHGSGYGAGAQGPFQVRDGAPEKAGSLVRLKPVLDDLCMSLAVTARYLSPA